MKKFKAKSDVFDYILEKFGDDAKTIIVRGSTANGKVKAFSDFDVEVYGKSSKYPVYEIHLCMGYPILISVYFYNYKYGSLIPKPANINVLKGSYTSGIDEIFEKEIKKNDAYNANELVVRKAQLMMDFFFKFVRTGDEKYLEQVTKKMDFSSLPPSPPLVDED